MKRILAITIYICSLSCSAPAQQKDVNTSTFQEHLASPGVQILDVRTAGEYQNGHIKNALQADWLQQEQFKDRVQYLDKSKPVMVYCASGGRSSKAATWLAQNGFTIVENLQGGFTQWKLDNKPVEGGDNTPQLTIEAYNSLTISSDVVLIDFGATWCPPCKKMEPVLADVEQSMAGKITLSKVDGGINTNIMQQLNVPALPTFIIYKKGKEVWRKQGIVSKEELVSQLSK